MPTDMKRVKVIVDRGVIGQEIHKIQKIIAILKAGALSGPMLNYVVVVLMNEGIINKEVQPTGPGITAERGNALKLLVLKNALLKP